MEGMGTRMGRGSSRYGSTSSALSGPVRKWKKQWVHVSPFPNPTTTNKPATSPLRLCRWTPLTQSSYEPPRRKFRYTPIADLEEQKSEDTRKVDGSSKTRKPRPLTMNTLSQTDDTKGAPYLETFQAAHSELKYSSVGLLNLELGLNGLDEDRELNAEVELPEIVKASSAGFGL